MGLAYSRYGQPNLALNEFRKDLYDWKNKHAMGILYLQMNSPQSANTKFQEARQRYETTVNKPNKTTLHKLHFDMILSVADPAYRFKELKTLVKKFQTYELYHALAASEFEINGATSDFEEYCNLAKSQTENTVNQETMDSWLTLVGDKIDTVEDSA